MEDKVTPFISPGFAQLIGVLIIALGVLITLRYAYRYYVFRLIDREGFHDPELQAMHLQMQREEAGKLITRTQLQLLICVAAAVATLAFMYFFVGVAAHG